MQAGKDWIAEELAGVDLGDARRVKRLGVILEDLEAKPGASMTEACNGDEARAKGLSRFISSPAVDSTRITQGHVLATVRRIEAQAPRQVLVAQDTTELSFSTHPKTRGLGRLDNGKAHGLEVHTGLALTPAGVPLGVLYQHVWARDEATRGSARSRHRRATADKESQRWLDTVAACEAVLPPEVETIIIGDREADIYDLLAMPRRPGVELLIRATQNRAVAGVNSARAGAELETVYLWDALRATPAQGQVQVSLRRADDRRARQAVLTVRCAQIDLRAPHAARRHHELPTLRIWAVLAEELQPPPDQEPVSWLLLSTRPVQSLADALQCLEWYTHRWKVERYHFVLKSGCRVEALQADDGQDIARALAIDSILAWRLLWLTYQARLEPDAPCTQALEIYEWQALYLWLHPGQPLAQTPPTLHQAVRWIAKLGGFLGRHGDGEPGVKVIWRGLRRLADIAAAFLLFNGPSPGNRNVSKG